jgi:hypothetical protein
LKEIFDFWHNVNMEDIEICEKVQVGTASQDYQGACRTLSIRFVLLPFF